MYFGTSEAGGLQMFQGCPFTLTSLKSNTNVYEHLWFILISILLVFYKQALTVLPKTFEAEISILVIS